MARCRSPRAHFARSPGRCAEHHRVPQQVRYGGRSGIESTLSSPKFVSFSRRTVFDGEHAPVIRGSALKALGATTPIPRMPSRFLSSLRPWTTTSRIRFVNSTSRSLCLSKIFSRLKAAARSSRRIERGRIKVNEEIEIVGLNRSRRPSLPHRNVQQAFGRRTGGR